MNFQDLKNAIALCDLGQINFQRANLYAFLFRNKWYPLRAVVNHACNSVDMTKDQCLRELIDLLKQIRIEHIPFNNCFPVPFNQTEKMNEIKILVNAINDLV